MIIIITSTLFLSPNKKIGKENAQPVTTQWGQGLTLHRPPKVYQDPLQQNPPQQPLQWTPPLVSQHHRNRPTKSQQIKQTHFLRLSPTPIQIPIRTQRATHRLHLLNHHHEIHLQIHHRCTINPHLQLQTCHRNPIQNTQTDQTRRY